MVNILLVDDSEYLRNLLKTFLTNAGHNVVGEAANAEEAIDKYQKLCPEIVLMDIVLEQTETARTGLDALKEILRLDPQAKIIICSALNQQTLINESMQLGAKGFVVKPFDPEKLLETVVMSSDLNIIADIGNIGAQRAVTVLSKLANQPIEIDVPKIETFPSHLITKLDGAPDRPVMAVHMALQKSECDILIAFELNEAAKISYIMTEKLHKQNVAHIQTSAIKEMGSNTICAFLSAISDFSDLTIVPSAPTLVTDSFEAIIDTFLAKMTISAKTALLFKIRLKKQASLADGVLIIFPSPEFMKQLINIGKKSITIEKPMLVLN